MTLLAPLPKSIATVSLSGTLPEKLEAAAAIGFDGVEIFENDLLTFDGSPADVRAIADGPGPGDRHLSAVPRLRGDARAAARPQPRPRRAKIRRHAGARHRPGAGVQQHASRRRSTIRARRRRSGGDGGAGRARGLRVGYEALAWGRHVNRWRHAWQIVQQADHPALGLIVDSFHTLALGDDPSGIAEVPAEKLFFVQLADAPRAVDGCAVLEPAFPQFSRAGRVAGDDFLRAVLACRLSRAAFAGDLQRRISCRAGPADRAGRVALADPDGGRGRAPPACPQPPRSTAWSSWNSPWTKRPAARWAKSCAASASTTPAATVPSRWNCFARAAINLILNARAGQRGGRAFPVAWPSVCAMALRVDDAARAVRRADALLCAGMARARRPRRAAHSRGARARRHADLSGAARCRRPQHLRGRLSTCCRRPRRRRCWSASTTSRRRCRWAGWTISCCSTARCSDWCRSRCGKLPIRTGWCAAAPWSARTAASGCR